MNEDQRLVVFRSQTKNVRELKSAWAHVNRVINALFLQNNLTAVHTQTKILALIYCALAEAVFSKLIHTPNGLTLDEIGQIKDIANVQGVKMGWIKCAELAIRRVDGSKSNYQPNVIKRLSSLIEEFIFDPSLLRNKLAHGQWSVALNRDNTVVNEEITREINDCTVIDLYLRVYSLDRLAAIIEDIVESPNKAHPRDYWEYLSEIEHGQGRCLRGRSNERLNSYGTKDLIPPTKVSNHPGYTSANKRPRDAARCTTRDAAKRSLLPRVSSFISG